jgi:putative FmdB family regulatory protein
MPTYEYACKSCGQHIDVVQSFTDDPLTECPNCGGVLRKVFGNIGISFKGSGFYKNDSRSTTSSTTPPGSSGSGDGASSSSGSAEGGSSDKGSSEKGSGSSDKGSSDKGSSGDKGGSSSGGDGAKSATPAKKEATSAK